MTDLTSSSKNCFPLSFNQKRLWLMAQQDSNNPAYNLQLTFQLRGRINYEVFLKSIRILFERQRTMFSVFKQTDGNPYIEIAPRKVNVDIIDFSQYNAGIRREKVLSFAGDELRKCFDLVNGPLYRLFLLKEDEENYVFHAVIHHIVFDGWSMGYFSREVSRIYTSLMSGAYMEESDLTYHSYDFAKEEEAAAPLGNNESVVEFWRETLMDCPPELKFPYDFPRKSVLTGYGHREPLYIPKTLTSKLKSLAESEQSSLFKTMLSVLGVLMEKYTGEDDICIGFPVSTRRKNPALEKIFGFFVSTSLLRLKIDRNGSFRKHLKYSIAEANKSIENSKLSFDKIIETVNPERRSNMNPLFQVSLSWWNDVTTPMDLDGIICERLNVKEGVAPMDISFYLWENGDHLEGEIECAADLISYDSVLRLKKNLLSLINLLVEKPDASLKSLSIISSEEVRMINEINKTQTDYPADKTIVQIFEEHVKNFPEKRAVGFKDKFLTYKELNEKANSLAHSLREAGVKVDTPVGVFMDKSVDIIVALLGILKAGGAYLPIDTEYPVQRINFIIQETDCKLLLTQSKYMGVDLEGADKLNLNSPDVYSEKITNPKIVNTPLDLAYIIYTSGTTGTPKGTCVPHRGVVRLVCKTNYIDFSPEDNVLLAGAIIFDASAIEIWGALLNGGSLFIVDKETILNPKELGDVLEKNDITTCAIATPLFVQLVENRIEIFHKLKHIVVGGDILSPLHANKVRKANPRLNLINGYGPTENSTMSTVYKVERDFDYNIPIGKPMSNSTAFIFDKNMNYQPVGIIGELYVGGDGISRGYLKRDELNKACFIEHPFIPGAKIYKTGDNARWLPDGNIEFHGRIDSQVKIRGYRIELGEIENAIFEFSGVKNCAVKVFGQGTHNPQIVSYIVIKAEEGGVINELKNFLLNRLPVYMVPAHIIVLDEMPMTPSGKIDRKALPEPEVKPVDLIDGPTNNIEQLLIETWKESLHVDSIGVNTNFFEAGGTSILIPGLIEHLKKDHNISIRSLNIFEFPTIKMLADFIALSNVGNDNSKAESVTVVNSGAGKKTESHDIAVIGMAGCFPGADNVEKFWDLIKTGANAISYFTREELEKKGVPDELLDNPDYVFANGLIDRAGMFEPSFFEITPREADFMDPQHRLFLEICYEALEDAGYAPRTMSRNIGVFAGAGVNNYFLKSLLRHPDALRSIGEFQNMVNNEKDFLATRVSYKLNLTGPSLDIQTACSTSLVAIHTACQSLLNNECDMALGGGVSLQYPRGTGYMQHKGSILSPTGYCRPFDEKADGTIVGEGAAVVMLKRLDDAIKDNDHIYAVIKSTAINNDGSVKVGYMAPGLDGQTKVIRRAQEISGISPDSITFVETHGTGTKLGDPIEIGALRKAFGDAHNNEAYCALGAVKANIGHLDAASGVTGVIKTILSLKHKQIPPLANFSSFNPELVIEGSPFYVPKKLKEWDTKKLPRRAAVSSFGIGGTNVHCILEEWTQAKDNSVKNNKLHLLPVSARTQPSLDMMSDRYMSFFKETELNISDIAYTMQVGREHFKHRQLFVGNDINDTSSMSVSRGGQLFDNPRTVFMFTGQGSQYLMMAKGLYNNFETFKKYLDSANDILKEECKIDLLNLLFSDEGKKNINDTANAQPAIVAVQYATVKLLEEFGIRPDFLIGHSIGELTAACVSGVISFNDLLILAARRGEIMQSQTKGSMLSVNMTEEELTKLLVPGVEISLINAPDFCVVSGTNDDIELFRVELDNKKPGIQTTLLKTSHAFHSYLMDPAISQFKKVVERVPFNSIVTPFISNTTGTVIKSEEARSSAYWADHIRKPVNFAAGVSGLLNRQTIFIEVGPGNMLTSLLSRFTTNKEFKAIPTIRGAKQDADDSKFFINALSQFWIAGGNINWDSLYNSNRHRVSLPTYAFNRKLHWVETKSFFGFDVKTEDSDIETYKSDEIEPVKPDRSGFTEPYNEPATQIQKELVKIWEYYLGIKQIGTSDDFFALGGHSLLASQVINNVNTHFKIDLSIEILFRTPTIAELENEIIEAEKKHKITVNLPRIKEAECLPVSNEQVRLWMVSQLDNNPAYNIPFTYEFKGALDEDVFVRSINEVFNRHSVLRGRVITVDIDPALVLDEKDHVLVNKMDFSNIPDSERRKRVEQFISEDIRKIFDFENDPLYRIYLIKRDDNEYIFHMTIHHINFDGWSWGIFVRDLKRAYTELSHNKDVSFNDEVFQYYEFAQWQQGNILETSFEKPLLFWKKNLEGYNGYLNFPYDYPRKEFRSGMGSREFFSVDTSTRERLKAIAKRFNVTDFVIYISAFSILLNRYSNDKDFCVGIPSANRFGSQIEKIIGFFVNTLVLRFLVNNNLSFSDYVKETKTIIVNALENQVVPFEKLVEELQPPRSFNTNPIYQVLFAWLNTPSEIFEFPGVNVERCQIKEGVAPLDITFYMWDEKEYLTVEVEYSIDVLSPETIHNVIVDYQILLEKIANDPEQKIGEL